MILISKFMIGSVALAGLAGSVVLPDAVDAARSLAVSLGWPQGAAEFKTPPADAAAEAASVSQSARHCSGSCDAWALLAQIR